MANFDTGLPSVITLTLRLPYRQMARKREPPRSPRQKKAPAATGPSAEQDHGYVKMRAQLVQLGLQLREIPGDGSVVAGTRRWGGEASAGAVVLLYSSSDLYYWNSHLSVHCSWRSLLVSKRDTVRLRWMRTLTSCFVHSYFIPVKIIFLFAVLWVALKVAIFRSTVRLLPVCIAATSNVSTITSRRLICVP